MINGFVTGPRQLGGTSSHFSVGAWGVGRKRCQLRLRDVQRRSANRASGACNILGLTESDAAGSWHDQSSATPCREVELSPRGHDR